MRRILRICIISLSIILLVLGMKFNRVCAQQWENVPQDIRQLVFEQSRFSQPITFQPPCSDDPSTKEKINASLINESFLNFLNKNKFVKVDKSVMDPGTKYVREYRILSYSDTIVPYLLNPYKEKFTDVCNLHIILAVRKLKTIDYTNEYEATPGGFKKKFFALTFTYTLSDIFPNLPQITKQFKGEARAFFDPDDGKWKLDKFSLEDQDNDEYMTLLIAQYQNNFIASELSFQYHDNSVVFFLQFEGGKPPYKYGKLTLNGRTYKEVFGLYTEEQKTRFLGLTKSKPLYEIYVHQLEKGGGGFTIFMSENWPFGWPPDISFPLQVGITIFDSAFPQKSAYVETIVDSGTMLSATTKLLPIYSPGSFFFSDECWTWIEKDGKKLEIKDTPKIETSPQKVKLLSPQDGSYLPLGNIPFSWNPVSNATKYQFILYNSRGQIALDTTKSSTSLTVALGIEETITWKVRAVDNSGNWGTWSNVWSLTLKLDDYATYEKKLREGNILQGSLHCPNKTGYACSSCTAAQGYDNHFKGFNVLTTQEDCYVKLIGQNGVYIGNKDECEVTIKGEKWLGLENESGTNLVEETNKGNFDFKPSNIFVERTMNFPGDNYKYEFANEGEEFRLYLSRDRAEAFKAVPWQNIIIEIKNKETDKVFTYKFEKGIFPLAYAWSYGVANYGQCVWWAAKRWVEEVDSKTLFPFYPPSPEAVNVKTIDSNYQPKKYDILINYDPNTGKPEHYGFVEKVDGDKVCITQFNFIPPGEVYNYVLRTWNGNVTDLFYSGTFENKYYFKYYYRQMSTGEETGTYALGDNGIMSSVDTPKIESSLYSGIDNIREGEFIFNANQQIALCVVQGGMSIEKVREELVRFLNETSDEVLAMGAKKDERINQVFIISNKKFTDMVQSIYESNKEMVVRLFSSINAIKGGPIVAYFTFQENKNE